MDSIRGSARVRVPSLGYFRRAVCLFTGMITAMFATCAALAADPALTLPATPVQRGKTVALSVSDARRVAEVGFVRSHTGQSPRACNESVEIQAVLGYQNPVTTATPATSNQVPVLVPESLPLGTYAVCARLEDGTPGKPELTSDNKPRFRQVTILSDSGNLQVIADPAVKVDVSRTRDPASYVDVQKIDGKAVSRFKVVVLGEGFSLVGEDNQILFGGARIDITWNKKEREEKCQADKSCGWVDSTRQLELDLPSIYAGKQELAVRVGGSTSKAVPVRLSSVQRWTPAFAAAVVLAVVVAMLGFFLTSRKSSYSVDGTHVSLLSSLFIERETDTYSLSKFQFYLWTAAAVYGYIYLTIARCLIQLQFEFAPVPENLPGILLVSAGTAALAQGVNNIKPKGAGEIQPSFADFISIGGVVVPERLQFLVWTILGVATFLLLIGIADPATVTELPVIPPEFLYLMGVSSFGYLGGRIARKAGPIITSIIAKPGSLILEVNGRFLSCDGVFQINGQEVKTNMIAENAEKNRRPEVIDAEDQSQDKSMAKTLKITINEPKAEWITPTEEKKPPHRLAVINPDGQRAEWSFTIPTPTAKFTATESSTPVSTNKKSSGETMELSTAGASIILDASETLPWFSPIKTYEWRLDENTVLFTTKSGTTSQLHAGECKIKLTVTYDSGHKAVAEMRILAK